MRKLLIFFLAIAFVLTFTACGGDEESTTSKTESTVSETESAAESKEESKEVSAEESKEESVNEPDEEVLDEGIIGPGSTLNRNTVYTYISDSDGHLSSYPATSIRFNQWNGEAAIGDTLLLTGDAGSLLTEACTGDCASLEGFAVIIVSYNMDTYRYEVTANYEASADKSTLTFPEDGFAIAVSEIAGTENEELKTTSFKKVNAANVTNVASYTVGASVELDGISVLQIHWDVSKADSAPVSDGVISAGEYGDAVLVFDGDSKEVDYRGFESNDKYATGSFYAVYDSEYLYLAWSIASENHSCPLSDGASGIWQYDCAQIVISTLNPNDSRNLNNTLCWSGSPSGTGTTAYDWNVEIGIAVSDDGKTLLCKDWFSNNLEFEGCATRNDDTATTIYEVKIPLSALNAECPGYETTFKSGTQLGISFSINTNDGTTRVVRLRDGGGIFGSNDMSKVPCITLE